MDKDTQNLLDKFGKGAVISMPQEGGYTAEILKKLLTEKKALGVYLTTVRSYAKVVEWLKAEKIDPSSLFFLDLVTRGAAEQSNLFVLREPSDFTELSVVITEVMENEGIEFLLIDQIGGLENYAEAASIKKFLHGLISYLKKINKSLIIVYGGSESKELMNFVVQVSDYHKEYGELKK